MADGKKSFVLYCDLIRTIEHLTDEQAGRLFKHVLEYVNDRNPETDDIITKLAFEPIKQQLKRDLGKWEKYINKQRENGMKGGRPPITQKTQAFFEKPKKADNVNVNVNVNDSVTIESRAKGFAPPHKDEVIQEMSKTLDDFTAMAEADKFINFYESKGWMVGKNKMKEWKAAVRNWLQRMKEYGKIKPVKPAIDWHALAEEEDRLRQLKTGS